MNDNNPRQIDKRTDDAIGGGKPITPPPIRIRGRPTKQTMVPWKEAEALYITTNYSTERIAQEYGCSPSIVREHSRKDNWVEKRRKHQSRVSASAISKAERSQALDLAGEVATVGKLAQGVLARLAQKIGSPRTKIVKCPCGCGHSFSIEIPHADVTVADLAQLIKIRSHLKGDPEFIVKVEEDVSVSRDLKRLSKQEVEDRMAELIREAEGYVLE